MHYFSHISIWFSSKFQQWNDHIHITIYSFALFKKNSFALNFLIKKSIYCFNLKLYTFGLDYLKKAISAWIQVYIYIYSVLFLVVYGLSVAITTVNFYLYLRYLTVNSKLKEKIIQSNHLILSYICTVIHTLSPIIIFLIIFHFAINYLI